MERVKVPKYQGVYFREHPARKHKGKPDRCFDINFKDRGRLVWEKVGWMSEGYSAAAAALVRAERIRALRHGEELPQRRKRIPTFGEAWEKYFAWAQANKRTADTDEFRYRGFKKDLEDKPLNEITPFLLEKMKSRMFKGGLSPQTVRSALSLIRGVFNKTRLWGHYQGENPVAKVNLPAVDNAARVRFLSPEEAKLVLEKAAQYSTQLYEICLVSLHAGLRAGEIFGLRYGDIDTKNGIIHVQNSKSGAARVAFMTKDLKKMFSEKQAGDPKDLIFLSQWGEKIKAVSGSFDKVVSALGLNDGVDDRRQRVVFHSLRHTFASWLALRGTPILTIQELLGHKRIEMTMRYAHLIPDVKRDAVAGLQKFFEQKGSGGKMMEKGLKKSR